MTFEDTLKEACKGNSTYQFILGRMYENNMGIPTNSDMARYWYTQAAEQGDALAIYHLDRIT